MRMLCLATLWLLGNTIADAASARLGQWEQLDFDSDPALNQHFFLYELARSDERVEAYVPLMKKNWAPYLNGDTTMENALTNLIEALSKPQPE